MDFKSSYRMEAVYFQKLKSDIDIAKSLMKDGNTEEAQALLENAVDVNGAVLLLYRNLGDVWGELGAQIQKTNEALKELKETTDKYHDELNEKIDDVNNTIIRLLNALEDRIAAVERDLATMSRVKILSLVNENGTYHIYDGTTEIDFDALSSMVEFPHDVILRGVVNGEETEFQLREFDSDTTDGSFEFYSTGLDNNVVKEITVTVLPDDSVNVATVTQEISAGNRTTLPVTNVGVIATITASDVSFTKKNSSASIGNSFYQISKTYNKANFPDLPFSKVRVGIQAVVFLNSWLRTQLNSWLSDGDHVTVSAKCMVTGTGYRGNIGIDDTKTIFKHDGELDIVTRYDSQAIGVYNGPEMADTGLLSFVYDEDAEFTISYQVQLISNKLDGHTITAGDFDNFVSLRYRYEELE